MCGYTYAKWIQKNKKGVALELPAIQILLLTENCFKIMQNFTKKGAKGPLGSPLNPPLKIAKGKYVCHLPCGFCLQAYHILPRKRIEQEKTGSDRG